MANITLCRSHTTSPVSIEPSKQPSSPPPRFSLSDTKLFRLAPLPPQTPTKADNDSPKEEFAFEDTSPKGDFGSTIEAVTAAELLQPPAPSDNPEANPTESVKDPTSSKQPRKNMFFPDLNEAIIVRQKSVAAYQLATKPKETPTPYLQATRRKSLFFALRDITSPRLVGEEMGPLTTAPEATERPNDTLPKEAN
jgi:hypothetical protein